MKCQGFFLSHAGTKIVPSRYVKVMGKLLSIVGIYSLFSATPQNNHCVEHAFKEEKKQAYAHCLGARFIMRL